MSTDQDASGIGEVTQSLRSLAYYHHDVFDQVSVDSLPDLGRKVVEEGESSLPCSWLMFWHTEN